MAIKISLDQAKSDKLFYFVANVVVYRAKDKRCLILKRDEREIVHPGKWALPGGKLEWKDLESKDLRTNDNVEDAVHIIESLLERETLEEAGIKIKPPLKFLRDVAFIRPDGIPVILLVFAAAYKSGEVVPEPGAFTDYAWVTPKEAGTYDVIEGLDREIETAITAFA